MTSFMIIGLLRLTNMNYYLSILFGFSVEVNNLGGNAFNFSNYFAIAFLGIVLATRLSTFKARWATAWPIYGLFAVYGLNSVMATYTNWTWILYQYLFLLVALVLHFYVQRREETFIYRFQRIMDKLFWVFMGFVGFVALVIMSQNSLSYYVQEFNEVFVQSVDDFGIMKQRYGYLAGFLVSYILFIRKGFWSKVLLLLPIAFTVFGIRSFIIGMIGATLIFVIRKPRYFLLLLVLAIWAFPLYQQLLYDTRFYAYMNGAFIVQNYPFGVGLGGYPVFTEINSRQLFANFHNVDALLDYIPFAPESDVVHIFGSLGLLLGTIHVLIQGRILWISYRLKQMMGPFEKCILFYFCFMTFFGISEDSIFSINYWIFFGTASGLVSSLLMRKKRLSERA